MVNNLDIALGCGGFDVNFNIGEELRDIIGELFVGDKKPRPPFGYFDFDVGKGEFGNFFISADNLPNPLAFDVVVNIPVIFDLEDSSQLAKI